MASACLAGMLCWTAPLNAQTLPTTVQWVLQDFPPAQILVNGQPGAGFRDEALRLIVANWPEAEHQFVVANAARTWLMLAAKEPVCYVGALQTPEREKQAYFTPFAMLPPLQLVVRKDSLDKFPLNADGEVKLPELLASPGLTGLLIDTRSYGKSLDDEIARRARRDAVNYVQAGDLGKTVPLMLGARRGDYLIEYDFVINYHRQQNAAALSGLVMLPIAGFSKPVVSNIVCARSPWGQQAIRRIDAILTKTVDAQAIRASAEKWLSPETLKRYRTDMNAFAQRRRKPSDPALFD